MKDVDLNKDDFWYENGIATKIDMSNGKHIHFTAVDKAYELDVLDPAGTKSRFKVPYDKTYHAYEIKGQKDQKYIFTIDLQGIEPITVPQMIVRVD